MKLRDHPGISHWPPTWLCISGSQEKKVLGEFGVLSEVNLSRVEPMSTCYLTLLFEDEQYMGTLLFRDAELCRTIFDVLKSHVRKPIQEIGDLELACL